MEIKQFSLMSRSSRGFDDALCCCEYLNKEGERSHIFQCCCDCEALDKTCERFISCRSIPEENCKELKTVLEDRCRLPGFCGNGAIQIRLDAMVPAITIPLSLAWATQDEMHTVYVLVGLPILLLVFYQVWLRSTQKQRTLMFFSWALTSVFLMLCLFDSIVYRVLEVDFFEVIVLHILFVSMLVALYFTKKDPGIITRSISDAHCVRTSSTSFSHRNFDGLMEKESCKMRPIYQEDVKWVDSRPFKDGKLVTWCTSCDVYKLPRSGHCNICNVCIQGRDHHCVWIDHCVGAYNHRAFVVAMVLFITTGYYGGTMTIRAICTWEIWFNFLPMPHSCMNAYSEFQVTYCFVGALYSIIAASLMCLALLDQFLLISQNITSQELHMAAVHRYTKCCCFARRNKNNIGFVRNWVKFLLGTRFNKDRFIATSTV